MTRTPVAAVRPLPVSVRPLGGETVTGYAGRLAVANGLTAQQLRLHVKDLAGLSATHTDLERAAPWVERLGRLTPNHFTADARRHSVYVRCKRSEWRPWPCPDCGYPQEPRTACLRCTHGHPTTVRSRGGAICNRHGRWHVNGHDVDVSELPEYLHAERCLSGTLWKRGISLSTGELQLAAALIGHWAHDNEPTRWMQRRADALGVDAGTDDTVLLFAYPEIVALTAVLTDMSFASYLLTSRFRLVQQVTALEAAVIGIVEGHANRSLHELAERVVITGKDAVGTAMTMRASHRTKRQCGLEKALIAASQRHRNCLLRHLSTVRIRITPYHPAAAAPAARTLARRRPLPDQLLSQ